MRPSHVMVVLSLLGPLVAHGALATPRYGLSVRPDGVLIKDGKPYRGIGVDYFDAFYRTFARPNDTSYDAGFATLQKAGIPFCRICGCGFWPVDQKLYQDNKKEFFRRLDGVVHSAEKHGIGLIPSLFWNVSTVPDLVGEPVSEWGNPQSKTQKYMQQYVKDVVTRYRNSPAIWGWEFGNEMDLGANLPNAADHRPAIVPNLGTPAFRTAKDDWTFETIRTAFACFGTEVRKYDPYRVIETGDAFPRPSAWRQWKENTWTQDTPAQFAEMLRDDSPDPIDMISVHAYGKEADRIRESARLARTFKKPLFVGEFGAPGDEKASEAGFTDLLTAIEESRAPLAAVWVFDHASQDDYTITATNDRSYQLRAITLANARIKAEMAHPGTTPP